MTSNGRPDYDAGDLVVCVGKDPGPQVDPWEPSVGAVYTCRRVFKAVGEQFAVDLEEDPCVLFYAAWPSDWFRKVDPKPPEFWTGTVDADAGEKVSA